MPSEIWKVAFPALEDLSISGVPMIRDIWPQQPLLKPEKEVESFCKLKSIEVWLCDQLEYVLPSYMLPQLHNLLELKIIYCKKMEVIVSNKLKEKEATNNDILVFPQLKTLTLSGLLNLKCFCTGTDQLLFSHKVILPVLKELKVEALDSIEEIWDKQSPSVNQETASFGQLRNITVEWCTKLVNLVPLNILGRLRNLQDLTIERCPNVEFIVFKNGNEEEEVADDSTLIISQLRRLAINKLWKLKSFYLSSTTSNAQSLFNHQVIFPVLETLHIEEVGNVIEIWDKQSIGLFEAQESFCQLMNLEVRDCNKLTHLFPSKMHLLLKNLKTLHVTGCETMEGVVGFEEELDDRLGKDQLCFSKLTSLYLIGLPKLVSFCTKMGEEGTTEGNPTIHAQPLFNGKVIFPVLETLLIKEMGNIIEIWDKLSITVFEAYGSFCQLMYMDVRGCNKLTHLFPSKMHRLLKNLKMLEVEDFETMEGVVGFEGEVDEDGLRNEQVCISKLGYLSLKKLPKLVSFYIKMGEVGTTEGNPTIHAQPLFNGKVAFPALGYLEIGFMPNITEIWDKKPLPELEQEIESFSKLAIINIRVCHQLVYVLPSYMLPRLQNLQELKIWHCKEVEVIVSKELMKEKEATDNDPIVFSQLRNVVFANLPKLESFYTGTQLIFSNKVAFPALEHLTITKVPMIKEIWDKQPLSEPEKNPKSFYKLMSIHVEECDQLVYVFPSYMLPQLRNLQKLVITKCKEMEEIISNKLKDKEATNNNIILFAGLKTVILQFLPNLKRLCSETQLGFSNKDAFPKINTIEVAIEDLPRWANLDTSSSIDPDLIFLINGTSRKEVATEESGTSSEMNTTMTIIKKKKKTWRRRPRMPTTTKEEEEKRTRNEEEETEYHISNLD